MYCSECGALNADGAQFCVNCGKPLNQSNATSAPSTSSTTSTSSSSTSASPPPTLPNISFGTIPEGQASFTAGKAISNAINLFKNPAAFMRQNKDQDIPVRTTLTGYVAILAAIPFLATLVGDLWYYYRTGLYGYAVAVAILTYILDIVAVFVIGYIIWRLAPRFGTTTTQDKSTLLAALVYTPVFLLSIFDIIPFLGLLTVLGLLYGLYILYIGLPIMLSTPSDRTLVYVIVIIVVALIVYAIVGAIIGAIAAAVFLASIL